MMRWLCFAIVLLAAPVCAQSVPVRFQYESVPNAVRLPPICTWVKSPAWP